MNAGAGSRRLIVLRSVVPPGFDHAAVGHRAARCIGKARDPEAAKPIAELPIGMRELTSRPKASQAAR